MSYFVKHGHMNRLSTSGARKYDAQNAVTRGGGYWCSEANIMPDREISWTAELRGPRVLTGITIVWVYAPQMGELFDPFLIMM